MSSLFHYSELLCLTCTSCTLGAKLSIVHTFSFPAFREDWQTNQKRDRERYRGQRCLPNWFDFKHLGRELNESYWLGLKLQRRQETTNCRYLQLQFCIWLLLSSTGVNFPPKQTIHGGLKNGWILHRLAPS